MDKKLTKRQLQYQNTLESIRSAVDRLVHETGFHKVSIRQICSEAGVSLGTFYHYFSNKNALLLDRYTRANEAIYTLYESKLKSMHPVDALEEMFYYYLRYMHTRVKEVLIPYSEVLLEEYIAWQKIEKRAPEEVARRLIRDGLREGKIKPAMAEESIIAIAVSLINGALYTQCMTKGAFIEGTAFLEGVNAFWEMLRS